MSVSSSTSSLLSMDSKAPWPDFIIKRLEWPASGVRFSFRDRYLNPDKLSLWLHTSFGPGKAKFALYNSHYYVMAPRKPNKQKWIGPERHDVDRALTSSVLGHRKGQDMKTYR
ncbi:uncharacterized protein PV06_00204 [Exophiala oligosperma]|uniref:Uncharacterized protein n=1 Tax=Exophiala oligosperma TaxID=215243 RepID=A0A0D2B5L4_9EURO|nr:uncharacterized protein PV06_00204 [Exophiala oligosperma]KIW47511.1 hypothetical protein PV06_00204 [Exophiala oligosperma]